MAAPAESQFPTVPTSLALAPCVRGTRQDHPPLLYMRDPTLAGRRRWLPVSSPRCQGFPAGSGGDGGPHWPPPGAPFLPEQADKAPARGGRGGRGQAPRASISPPCTSTHRAVDLKVLLQPRELGFLYLPQKAPSKLLSTDPEDRQHMEETPAVGPTRLLISPT
ncbi:hypothetical protein P7K49_020692 [Saguinus oedipus]|uniref:Uncharacterized protein n=1 Tax=Saguinus oedipus TaxID=9490 RepID=A0ABQ9V166_SAGOE|nr:hypothetical protein P7K49_020692 [Saguinus oedipus]